MTETYEEALARCDVLKPESGLTDVEKAEKLAFAKAMAEKHDAFYAEHYGVYNGIKISSTLQKQYGVKLSPPDNADEGDMGESR